MTSFPNQTSMKSKGTTKVKPILRKFSTEKASLDLDRPAVEQGFGNYASENRSIHDVSFTSTRRGYHNRSTSGASHLSTTTTTSAHRNGSFVHPFQQTPRPYTPPAINNPTFPTSLSDRERESSRESVPLVEGDEEEGEEEQPAHARNTRSNSTYSNFTTPSTNYTPRASTDLPSLRVPTKSLSSSRLTLGHSMSNLHSSLTAVSSADLVSPTESVAPAAGFRSSMEKGFRIRSHSHVESGTRFETVHEARRAWVEKEQAKADKLAQEETRAAEKRARKAGRKSSASEGGRSGGSKSDAAVMHEKPDVLFDSAYESMTPAHGEHTATFTHTRRSEMSTKKKTQSNWMAFLIWFRTRLLRLKKH